MLAAAALTALQTIPKTPEEEEEATTAAAAKEVTPGIAI
jgi:hypothetical protein